MVYDTYGVTSRFASFDESVGGIEISVSGMNYDIHRIVLIKRQRM